ETDDDTADSNRTADQGAVEQLLAEIHLAPEHLQSGQIEAARKRDRPMRAVVGRRLHRVDRGQEEGEEGQDRRDDEERQDEVAAGTAFIHRLAWPLGCGRLDARARTERSFDGADAHPAASSVWRLCTCRKTSPRTTVISI